MARKSVQIASRECALICESLNIQKCDTWEQIREQIRVALVRLEASINNLDRDSERPKLSLQGAPVDLFTGALAQLEVFRGKIIFFLIDEYENFLDYQQKVVNTLIKHPGEAYTFKIGVKELGFRQRVTLNENEQLISPADYVLISISDRLANSAFDQFAREVFSARVQNLRLSDGVVPLNPTEMFEVLTEEQEATELGIEDRIQPIRHAISGFHTKYRDIAQELSPLQLYYVQEREANLQDGVQASLLEYQRNRENWIQKYENYKYSLLFTIRVGKPGRRKFYSGWDTLVGLSGKNIRYLLELVDQSFTLHLLDGQKPGEPINDRRLTQKISPQLQSDAAQLVGKKNLSELEGLSTHGATLTRLLLGLGRVFGVMAAEAIGHAPEADQFDLVPPPARVLAQAPDYVKHVSDMLVAAIMHLALVRSPGTKASDPSDTREYEYQIHPIFSAFFNISYRKKRKISISYEDFYLLIKDQRAGIRKILDLQHRSDDVPFSEHQLDFYNTYVAPIEGTQADLFGAWKK